jgi:hypothetical protein
MNTQFGTRLRTRSSPPELFAGSRLKKARLDNGACMARRIISKPPEAVTVLMLLSLLAFYSTNDLHARQVTSPKDTAMRDDAATLISVAEHSDSVDRGRVSVGDQVVRRVVLQNKSPRPYKINLKTKSCGCVSVKFDGESIDPDGELKLLLHTTAAEAGGKQSHYVVLSIRSLEDASSRETEIGSLIVDFEYTPAVDIVCGPKRLSMLGTVSDSSTASVLVRRADSAALLGVLRLSCDQEWLKCERTDHASGARFTVLAVRANGRSVGVHRATIKVEAEDAQSGSEVDVVLRVEHPVLAFPTGLTSMSEDVPSTGAAWSFELRAHPKSTLRPRLAKVRLAGELADAFQCELRNVDNQAHHVVVTIDPQRLVWLRGRTGDAAIEVLDSAGEIACAIPIVWFGCDWDSLIALPK